MINIDWENIPNIPGVYIWKGDEGQVLYVGKAKKLKQRMQQYFRDDLPPKNKLLVKNIVDFDFQVCASEMDALLLEETLINDFEPKYNIKIKSAKKYPYIQLKRNGDISLNVSHSLKFSKGSKFFGPFPDGFGARRIIKILSSVLPLDECLAPNSGKACLNYEMGRCLGSCKGKINENEKNFVISQVEDFFKGKTDYVINKLKERIEVNNELLNFEESKNLVDNLMFIDKLNEQKTNAFKDVKHRDVINYYIEDDIVSISIMYVRFGSANLINNFISKELNGDPKDILESFVHRYYKKNMIPDEVIVPFDLDWANSDDIKFTTPELGKRKDLLDLVAVNAKESYINNVDSYLNKISAYEEALAFLRENIVDKNITNIEMVDISSTMGSEQVGAVIRFKDGEPYKEAYRKFIINSTDKMDDYASTEEVVRRHFTRLMNDSREMPDLFIVDGKHQLTNAKKIFDEFNITNVTLIGLIKDDKHKTNAIINEQFEIINLNKKSKTYLFLSRLQDEVHRFVIQFHRKRRERSIVESKLDDFTFLNELDKQNLFKEFKSIRKILTANETELRKVLTESKIKKFLKEK